MSEIPTTSPSVGQIVEWTTQVRNRTITRRGIIIREVPPNTSVDLQTAEALFSKDEYTFFTLGCYQKALIRNEKAFFIAGETPTSTGKTKLYFPDPRFLRVVS